MKKWDEKVRYPLLRLPYVLFELQFRLCFFQVKINAQTGIFPKISTVFKRKMFFQVKINAKTNNFNKQFFSFQYKFLMKKNEMWKFFIKFL